MSISLGLVLIATGLMGPAFALTSNQTTDMANRIREEINQLEVRMQEAEKGRRNAVEQLQDIERKIELRRRLIRELEKQASNASDRAKQTGRNISGLEREISLLSSDLIVQETSLEDLKKRVSERINIMYRYMRSDKVLLLITSRDLSELTRRRKYWSFIERYDRQQIERLRQKRNEIADVKLSREELKTKLALDQAQRLSELEKLRGLIRDRRSEEDILQNERQQQRKLISRIESDNELLRALLDERRKSLQEIEREINRLTQQAPSKIPDEFRANVPFQDLAGKLPWPVESRIISQSFGPNRHPRLGTTTVNPGVDFKVKSGDEVRAVGSGYVKRIAWLRGFGNTIILDHGDGFYTVYARIDKIFTSEGDLVAAGQPIGAVSDSEEESEFHFEVWTKRENQNPLNWLRK